MEPSTALICTGRYRINGKWVVAQSQQVSGPYLDLHSVLDAFIVIAIVLVVRLLFHVRHRPQSINCMRSPTDFSHTACPTSSHVFKFPSNRGI